MQTLSADAFKQKYGTATAEAFKQPQQSAPDNGGYVQNLTNAVGGDLANRIDRFNTIQNNPDTGAVTKGVQMFGQGAGLAANTIEQTVLQAPGIKQAAQAVGTGINWLATSELSPIKHLGDVIGSSKTLQAATHLYDTDQSFKDTIDAVGNIVRLGGDVSTVLDSANFAANVTNKVIRKVKDAAPDVIAPIKEKVSSMTADASPQIMNRVARLKPTDMTSFEKMSGGQTVGDYLSNTGNFGAPDKIITNEATKFTNSIQAVDSELAKLPGVYKNGAVTDALDGLMEKAGSVSGNNVKAPYYTQVQDLLRKNASTGLTMDEINIVKRLYERNVKLGYSKLLNADKIEQATNIDSAMRNWQVDQAAKLGFTNISELNKQTQLSKFLINKLGDQLIGQAGLNGVNLTDWVVLGGGNPSSVAAFLTKKFFSSKAVQAKMAEFLKQGGTTGPVKANVVPTNENVLRRGFPNGAPLELPAGSGGPSVQNFVPRINYGPTSFEKATPPPSKYSYNPVDKTYYEKGVMGGKRTQEYQANAPTQIKKSTTNTIAPKPTTIPPELQGLAKEAQKYSSAEEFVKAQGETLYHGSPNAGAIKELKSSTGAEGYFGNGVYLTRDQKVANSFTKRESMSPNLEPIGDGNFQDINTGEIKKGGKPGVVEANLPKDIKLKRMTIDEMDAEIEKYREPNGTIDLKKARNSIRDKYVKQGYDGFEVPATKYFDEAQTVIFPQSEGKIMTKSQLTDFYNKVKGKK
jgi:hypothetical protein